MKGFYLCRDPSKLPKLVPPVVVVLGNFDGVHLGHQALLKKASEIRGRSGTLVTLSFYPHPVEVLGKGGGVKVLTALRQKCSELKRQGVSLLYLIHFTEQFSQLSADEFFDEILRKTLSADNLVIGPDARVGKGREGDAEFLVRKMSALGKSATILSFVESGGQRISSGTIRKMLIDGDVSGAKEALGRPYALQARVVRGDGRGSKIGFPTANMLPKRQLIPKNGVYATRLVLNEAEYPSVTNIGVRPTFGGTQTVIETHILGGYSGNCYGDRVELIFIKRLRDEVRFSDVTELIRQIEIDAKEAERVLLSSVPHSFRVLERGRLDQFLMEALKEIEVVQLRSRSQVKGWIESGVVTVNGDTVKKAGFMLSPGTEIKVTLEREERAPLVPYDISLKILYEDKYVIVVDKPYGLSMHPGAGNKAKTLVNALVSRLGQFELSKEAPDVRPGIVHRLDKDTTGVVVVAKDPATHLKLSRQFSARTVGRAYYAFVYSTPRGGGLGGKQSGTVETEIGRDPTSRIKMAVVKSKGRRAVSHWKLLETTPYGRLLEVRLETGRTHQIRVHMNHLGAPVIGDKTYGDFSGLPSNLKAAASRFGRQALHAYYLEFDHPETGTRMSFESELPSDFQELLRIFREFKSR